MTTVKHTTSLLNQIQTVSLPWTKIYAVSAAVFTGVVIISLVGFAGAEVLHNAAHDIRHGLSFPCH